MWVAAGQARDHLRPSRRPGGSLVRAAIAGAVRRALTGANPPACVGVLRACSVVVLLVEVAADDLVQMQGDHAGRAVLGVDPALECVPGTALGFVGDQHSLFVQGSAGGARSISSFSAWVELEAFKTASSWVESHMSTRPRSRGVRVVHT